MGDTPNRVRMNVSMNSKGFVQLEITAESESVEKSRELLDTGLKEMRSTVTALGYKIADEQ